MHVNKRKGIITVISTTTIFALNSARAIAKNIMTTKPGDRPYNEMETILEETTPIEPLPGHGYFG
jgi:hypothetical protein